MADPHVCERCAGQGPTCCRLEPGNEEFCFPLSEAERDRILAELGGDMGAFAQQANTSGFIANMKTLFPGEEELVEELFHPNKFHLRLAVDADGACRLLGPRGCTLSREARPYYCRLFPLWPVGKSIRAFVASRCLAQQEARGLRRLLAMMDTTEKAVRELHGRLRLAWGLPPQRGMPCVPHKDHIKKKGK